MKSLYILFFLCTFFLASRAVVAQQDKPRDAQAASSIDPKTGNSSDFSYLPSTSNNVSEKKKNKKFQIFSSREKRKYKNSYAWQLDQKMAEYEARMKDVVKQDRKEAKLAKKPKYSDQSYFGHKNKPKKRKPGKRKFCKECQLVH